MTVVVPKGLRTSAGVPVTSKVSGTAARHGVRYFRVIRSRGAVKVRTFGKKGWRLVLRLSASANAWPIRRATSTVTP